MADMESTQVQPKGNFARAWMSYEKGDVENVAMSPKTVVSGKSRPLGNILRNRKKKRIGAISGLVLIIASICIYLIIDFDLRMLKHIEQKLFPALPVQYTRYRQPMTLEELQHAKSVPIGKHWKWGDKGYRLDGLGDQGEEAYNLGNTDHLSYRQSIISAVEKVFANQKIVKSTVSQYLSFEADLSHSTLRLPTLGDLEEQPIFMTDYLSPAKTSVEMASWLSEEPEWEVEFLPDQEMDIWVSSAMLEKGVKWTWSRLTQGVLRADMWRYLVMALQGGVYTDADTELLQPIHTWAKPEQQLYNISATDGDDWETRLAEEPSMILGIEIDAHRLRKWRKSAARPIQITQWTFSSVPFHPIFIDTISRIMKNTEKVERRKALMDITIEEEELNQEPGWKGRRNKLQRQKEGKEPILNIMDHTGPGVFTDSVLAYLKARYRVEWHELRGLARPLRIGEIVILPSIGFAALNHDSDWHSGMYNDPQAVVRHGFRGSWKDD